MDSKQLHSLVMNKFINKPYGHLLDYVGPLPTPEDCEKGFPNVIGWWTPIENGAFFTGLYLHALVCGYECGHTYLAEDIKEIKNGLCHLQDVAKVGAFIARGVGTDGKCHYKCSSDDQIAPFLLGMWKYRCSPLCTGDDRRDVDERILRFANEARNNKWLFPTEIEGVLRGSCHDFHWRAVAQRLFLTHIAFEISGDKMWENEYLTARDVLETLSPYTRLEVCVSGVAPFMVRYPEHAYFWIYTAYHLMQCELYKLDKDEKAKNAYLSGIKTNGEVAIEFTRDFEKMGDNYSLLFDSDWRKLKQSWKPIAEQGNTDKFASNQCAEWCEKLVPARREEHTHLANSLFGAWVTVTGKIEQAKQKAYKNLLDCIDTVKWDKLNLCYAFIAESVIYEYEYENKN